MENVTSATPHAVNGSNLDNSNPIDARQQDSPELRAFIDRVPALAWSALPDGSLDFLNKRFRDYTGLSSDKLYGSEWKSAIHLADFQKFEAWWQDLLHSPKANTTEVRLRRFDGSSRWFLLFADPLRDESGNVVKWYGTNIDIEDRKRVEQILRAREESWLQIVDNIPGLVATMGATGEVEFLNRQTLEYFGKSNEDLKNWALSDAVHPDDLPRIIQARIKSIEEGTIYDVEHRCRRVDGVYRWFQVRGLPVRNAEDTITGWYLLLTDIDDRKRAEEALQSHDRNLSLTINTLPVITWSARPDGSLEFYNQRGLDYLGLSAEEARGWGWAAAIHPDDLNRLTDYWRAIRLTGEAGEIEARLRRFNGEYRWFLFRACAFRDESGAIVKWYGTNADIEDRKRAERELQRSEAFLAKGQRISHTGSYSWSVATDEIAWSEELYRIFEFDTNLPVTFERITSRVHPDDLQLMQDMIERMRHAADDFEYEHRLLMPDQSIKHIHLFAHPVQDKDGRLEYIGAVQDVTRQRLAEKQLREGELNLRGITQTIPGMLWSSTPEGDIDYCNRPWVDFTTMTAEQSMGWGWTVAIYPDDRDNMIERWRSCLASGTPFDTEARVRRFDGAYRWFLFRANPLRDESGKIVKWYGTSADIEDSKRREEVLRASEGSWRQIIDNIPGFVTTTGAMGEVQFFNHQTLEYFGKTPEELRDWTRIGIVHPDDLPHEIEAFTKSLETGQILDIETRLLRADGVYRWFQTRSLPVRNAEGTVTSWNVLLTDIDDRKRAEEKVRQSEQDLRTITDTIPQPIVVLSPNGNTLYVNQVALDYTGYTLDQLDERGFWAQVFHPDDVKRLRAERQERLLSGVPFELEFRALYKGRQYRWILMQYNPLKDESGQTIRWYSTATDIDDRKRAEEKLRQSEAELRTITDTVRQPIMVLAPDGTMLYANRVALDQTGLTLDEAIKEGFFARVFHPDDVDRLRTERQERLSYGAPFDFEMRALFKNGEYRWTLLQYNPLKDESGQIIRWYATATDIDDQKSKEERLRNENVKLAQERVYLEEQIRSEMGFEQIIGNSAALKHVLELVETVAPNDSTVLLLGETGTGKELIARAIHERSRRKAKTFVKLNCAAIPTGLLESELFGHEKGAFTGAIIQKAGRMELADQGTLFLDEVGDIPFDIQPKLLRALQEKEFERLGSTHTRKVNLRLVAATNRNLEKMVTEREFRSDLFYRLNVFPIRIPALRDRKDDIPLLAIYFVQKFAKQMQKRINSIPVATMKALTAWEWPGNIRELENFIERAVILTKGESLVAPLAELRKVTIEEPVRESAPKREDDVARIVEETIASLKRKSAPRERTKKQHDEIVRVLTECKGRVGGADGAAVRMGLSRTTLMYRMKKLGIDPSDYA